MLSVSLMVPGEQVVRTIPSVNLERADSDSKCRWLSFQCTTWPTTMDSEPMLSGHQIHMGMERDTKLIIRLK